MTIKLAILGTRGIPARYGGFETFAEQLAVSLVAHGAEVTVFCEAEQGKALAEYKGVRLEYVPAPRVGALTTLLFDCRSLWRARKNYDVVYMLGYGASLFCFIPRLWGSEVWINMDGIEWSRSKWSPLARMYLRLMESVAMWTPTRIVADAESIRTHLATRHRRLPPCTVIPYGASVIAVVPDPELLDTWTLTPDGYYIVVCRLEPENHVLEIIEGFVKSSSRYPLIVVGNHTPETPYLRQLLQWESATIRFIGGVYDKAKLQALRYHARGYFHGHAVGGTNPSLLEAMGCGNAVIAHDNPFNREVAGEAAVYFKHADDLPKYLEWLETYPQYRRAMQAAARRRISDRYSPRRVVDDYLELLHSGTEREPVKEAS